MEDIDKTTEISFHGIDYIMRVSCRDDNLCLIIEQKDNGSRWKNTFTSAYVEEITQKTGNAKKMNVFVKMLVSSLGGNSDSVFMDILTYHDLEMLKARKQKNPTSTSYTVDKTKSNKRYLILTYVGEFDKVHYPLPLNFEENPDIETLKNTITRLRTEIDDLRSTKSLSQTTGEGFYSTQDQRSSDVSLQFKSENDDLKKKIKTLEESLSTVNNSQSRKPGAVENDLLIKSKMDLETELANVKQEYVKDVGKLKKRVEDAEKELEDSRNEVKRLRSEMLSTDNEQLAKSGGRPGEEGDFSFSKKIITRHQKEIEKLSQELENMRGQDKKQKTRIRQLETELEAALKRVTYSRGSNQGTGSPYSRSRGNSPSNSANRSTGQTAGGRSYSPGFNRKDTPPARKQSPTNQRTNIFNRTPPSSKKTPETANLYGVLKQRSSNSPSLRTGLANNPVVRKITPQKQPTPTVTRGSPSSTLNQRKPSPMELQARKNSPGTIGGVRKQSPGKISPSSTLNRYSPKTNVKPTYNTMGNSITNTRNAAIPSKTQPQQQQQQQPKPTYQIDSDDDTYKNSTLKSSFDNSLKGGAPKLKENIQELKDSKATNNSKSQIKDLEASVDVGDIDERLNKLQDLLRMAKS